MPDLPPSACIRPACPGKALSGQLCPKHRREYESQRKDLVAQADVRRPSAARRGYGHAWRKVRASVLTANPTCQIRGSRCSLLATEVDHIVPKPEGTDDPSNLQSACKPCHSQKTAMEDKLTFRRKWHKQNTADKLRLKSSPPPTRAKRLASEAASEPSPASPGEGGA